MKLTKDAVYLVVIALLVALCGQFYYTYHYKPLADRQIHVYYNQETQANQQVIDTIQNANQFVYFAVYTFTRDDIKDALLGAKHRGLDVKGVMDRDQTNQIDDQKRIYKELQDAGIPLTVEDHTGIMHMKLLVTDNGYESGSYNWTAAATNINDEVLEVGKDDSIRKQYLSVIEELFSRNVPSLPK